MYKRTVLKNGVRIITIPMKGTQTFTILVMVATGSRYETRENNGISHFLEHMFFKGTKKRPNTLAISTALDKVGGEYNAFTGKEYTGYYAKVDGQHSALAIDVVSDILLNSKLESKEIAREKGVIIEEINMYTNNPIIYIDDLFEQCFYGDSPAGWDTIGTKENVAGFKRKDFIQYLKAQYQGKDIVVGLAGKFRGEDVNKMKNFFARFPKGEKNQGPQVVRAQTSPQIKLKQQKVKQVNMSLGVSAYSYSHKDYYAAKVLGVLLGGSMSSRLFTAVRERQGLAYQVHTQVESYNDSGYLTTTVGTSPDKVGKVIRIVLAEYKKVVRQTVNENELKKAKDYIKGKLILNLESSDNMASWFTRQETLDQEILTPEEYFKKIKNVTAKALKRVSKDIFRNEKLNLAMIGQFRDREVEEIKNTTRFHKNIKA